MVAQFVDCFENEVDGVMRVVERGSKPAFVADVDCAAPVFIVDEIAERVVGFGDHHGRFCESFCFNRNNHEFLNAKVAFCMSSSINNIRVRYGKYAGFAEGSVEWQFLGVSCAARGREADTEDRVCAEASFIFRAVDGDHNVVEFFLVEKVVADEFFCDDRIDVMHRHNHVFAVIMFGVVAEFKRFINAC